jgi:hypothetical protein
MSSTGSIEARFADFYSTLYVLQIQTKYISEGHGAVCDVEKIKKEYEDCATKIPSLESDISKIANAIPEPIKSIVLSQFQCLKSKCNKLKTKIDENFSICEISTKLDQLYKDFNTAKRGGDELKNLEELKGLNFNVHKAPKLSFLQKLWIVDLDELIQCRQKVLVEEILKKMDGCVNDALYNKDFEAQPINSLKTMLFQDLPSCERGKKVQQHIFEQLWNGKGNESALDQSHLQILSLLIQTELYSANDKGSQEEVLGVYSASERDSTSDGGEASPLSSCASSSSTPYSSPTMRRTTPSLEAREDDSNSIS